MPQTDLPLADLRVYRPTLAEPDDLDAFWAATLAEARAHPLEATFEPVATGLAVAPDLGRDVPRVRRVDRQGLVPSSRRTAGPLPAVVEYVGYGGGRGLPHERVLWAAAGYAHLVMDTRGQGSSWIGR